MKSKQDQTYRLLENRSIKLCLLSNSKYWTQKNVWLRMNLWNVEWCNPPELIYLIMGFVSHNHSPLIKPGHGHHIANLVVMNRIMELFICTVISLWFLVLSHGHGQDSFWLLKTQDAISLSFLLVYLLIENWGNSIMMRDINIFVWCRTPEVNQHS